VRIQGLGGFKSRGRATHFGIIDPCRLVRPVNEAPWLDLDREVRNDPATLCGKVNEVLRLTSDYQASTSNRARENLIHRPDHYSRFPPPRPPG
jgi:hypothetical protein